MFDRGIRIALPLVASKRIEALLSYSLLHAIPHKTNNHLTETANTFAGTGKTTAVLALARALYGPELYRQRILELNASDERGIKVIREKVKTFAQGTVGSQKTP